MRRIAAVCAAIPYMPGLLDNVSCLSRTLTRTLSLAGAQCRSNMLLPPNKNGKDETYTNCACKFSAYIPHMCPRGSHITRSLSARCVHQARQLCERRVTSYKLPASAFPASVSSQMVEAGWDLGDPLPCMSLIVKTNASAFLKALSSPSALLKTNAEVRAICTLRANRHFKEFCSTCSSTASLLLRQAVSGVGQFNKRCKALESSHQR